MAIFRNIQMSFWTDAKVSDDFTACDRLMYLYLLTNPHTNLSGCYQVTVKQISSEIGFDVRKVRRLLSRFDQDLQLIRYNEATKELLILNWYKYNWTKSEKFRKPLLSQIKEVKDDGFREYLMGLYNGIDSVSIPYTYGMDTTVTDTDTVDNNNINNSTNSSSSTNNNINSSIPNPYKQIIENLNELAGRRYAWDSARGNKNREYIDARMKEGYTVEDFLRINALKCKEWGSDPYMKKFLRPETLYSRQHFESYLNEPEIGGDYFT